MKEKAFVKSRAFILVGSKSKEGEID